MASELISVIVPIYNVEQYLLRCVESIQRQTYTNLEIILVDDGSPDNCPQMCDEIQKTDSRIKVVHKENGGLGYARNSGLDIATGKYVTFIDSDDWISDDHIENLYRAISECNADAAIGSYTSARKNGMYEVRNLSLREGIYEGQEIIDHIVLPLIGPDVDYPNDIQVNASSCMNLYSMHIVRTNNLKFTSENYAVSEDLYFNIDYFSFSNRLIAINENGYFYFENVESISRKYNPKRFERTLNSHALIKNLVLKHDLIDRVEHRAERSYLMRIRIAIRQIVTSDLNRSEKLSKIRKILDHEVTRTVLNRYPVNTFVPAMRLLTNLMKSRNVTGVYYLMKFREISKRQNLLKNIVKLFGIGNYK